MNCIGGGGSTQALLTQMSQTAVCNRLRSVEQQLCRWLLLSHDRLQSNELIMTQELIANMLGVRREGVSVAANRLQHAGLIRYKRGRIEILDRPGLESTVCECCHVVRKECDRLLADPMNPFGSLTHNSRNVRERAEHRASRWYRLSLNCPTVFMAYRSGERLTWVN